MARLRVDKIASVGVSTETTGSVFFDGTGDILISRSDGLAPELNDYTAEGWVNVPSTTGLTTCRFFGTGEKLAIQWVHSTSGNPGTIPTNWNRVDVGVGTYSAGELYTKDSSTRAFIFDLGQELTSVTFDFSNAILAADYFPAWYVSQGSVATWTNKGAIETDSDGVVTITDSTPFRYVGLRSISSYQGIVATLDSSNAPGADTGSWGFKRDSSDGNLNFFNGGSWIDVGASISEDTWYHLAAVRKSNVLTVYVDGAAMHTENHTSNLSRNLISIGGAGINTSGDSTVTDPLRGYVSNVRLTMGALYTGDFIPPTTELDVVTGTAFVGCYDGTNTFAEKTHKSLFSLGDRSSTPTPSATDSPIGISTFNPGLLRTDPTAGPVFQGGAGFTSQNWLTLPKGTTTERFVEVANNAVSASSARGVFGGGIAPSYINTLVYITISTAGDAQDFGDLTVARGEFAGSFASSTRGVFAGGRIAPSPGTTNVTIDYVTISTIGDATDFGDLITAASAGGGCSSSTRGLTGGFSTPTAVNTIEYVTIATTGNAKDYGDLTTTVNNRKAFASPTRGVWSGGEGPINTMDYVTIQSTGNSFDFGDLQISAVRRASCLSNATRGITGGGVGSPAAVNTIQYVTIQSTGNSVDFGDLTSARHDHAGLASLVRGVFAGGHPGFSNVIDFITIATLGDATDFGDVPHSSSNDAGCSNGHGGLG